MCGIVACHTTGSSVEYLRSALRRLEYRGYDSAGLALQTTVGDVAILRSVGRVSALDKLVRSWAGPDFGDSGIGHTRWATHGAVTAANAHPHSDCTGRISVVHNGVVVNAGPLRAALTAAGHVFASSVDSEVLVHLIEEARMGGRDLFTAVQDALARVAGTWALAVLEAGTGRIVVAANGSPLLIARTQHGDFAASDFAAIADWADEYRVLDDGDIVDLASDELWSNGGAPVRPRALTRSTWGRHTADLNDYTDYMAKEIDEQPEAASRLIDYLVDDIASGSLWNNLGLAPFERLRIIGCGTSLNAGQVVGRLAGRLGGIPATTTVGSEATDDVAEAHQLSLVISQSGETADVLHAAKSEATIGSPLLALTNSWHSTLARRADAVISCSAGPEIGVAATKTFVCQIIAGAAVVISALVAMDRISALCAARLADDLRRLPDQLAAALTTAKCLVPPLAEGLSDAGGFLFISRGTGLPYAAEGALKLKELTYRWAEHFPAGELKHGPLALVGDGTPVIVVDNADEKLATTVAEVKARGGRIITVGSAGSAVPVVDDPFAPWGPITAAVPLQVLARTIALALNRDVDRPRNLAKSVTVE